MGAEGIGFFLSDTDEDYGIVHWTLSAHLMGPQVFGFLTLKVKQRDGLLRGEALNFSNEFSGVCPRSAGEAIGCPRRRQRNPINPGPCWS